MALRAESPNCDRARAWASLRLDGEISELEEAMLDVHLGRCATCSAYVETLHGAVLMLRAQPPEQIEHQVVVTGRRRVPVRAGVVVRAAAVVVALVGVTAVFSTQSAKSPSSPAGSNITAVDDTDLEQLRALRVLQLGGRPPRGSGVGEFGAVTSRVNGPAL